jgi:hypothetical protein
MRCEQFEKPPNFSEGGFNDFCCANVEYEMNEVSKSVVQKISHNWSDGCDKFKILTGSPFSIGAVEI